MRPKINLEEYGDKMKSIEKNGSIFHDCLNSDRILAYQNGRVPPEDLHRIDKLSIEDFSREVAKGKEVLARLDTFAAKSKYKNRKWTRKLVPIEIPKDTFTEVRPKQSVGKPPPFSKEPHIENNAHHTGNRPDSNTDLYSKQIKHTVIQPFSKRVLDDRNARMSNHSNINSLSEVTSMKKQDFSGNTNPNVNNKINEVINLIDDEEEALLSTMDIDDIVARRPRSTGETLGSKRSSRSSYSHSSYTNNDLSQHNRIDNSISNDTFHSLSKPSPRLTTPVQDKLENVDDRVEKLRASMLKTRTELRRVREEYDDLCLEGGDFEEDENLSLLETKKKKLEQHLKSQSKLLQTLKTSPSTASAKKAVAANNSFNSGGIRQNSDNSINSCTPQKMIPNESIATYSNILQEHTNESMDGSPKCGTCGKHTTIKNVRNGVNINRSYYCCEICGFNSWADDNMISDSKFNLNRKLTFPKENKRLNCSSSTTSVLTADVSECMRKSKRLLRNVFGHNSFRPGQEQIVQEAFSKRDVFVLMPTGGGKSLCYQLPACLDIGVTIVVSPLVSLIQDQVQQLQALDIGVAHLSGDQDYESIQRPVVAQLFRYSSTQNVTDNANQIRLLYVTPEKIASSPMLSNLFNQLYTNGKLARFVIDEAHCISQWGHDFRPDYMNLKQLRSTYPNVPIMALTATANGRTEADIVKNLKLDDPFITRSSFNRENLIYDVRIKAGKYMDEIAEFVQAHAEESGIIYCLSRLDCERVAEFISTKLNQRQVSFYHAGLDPEDRAQRHHDWSRGKIKLIVATLAFGMGINKPDVRYVIHHTIPQSVTHYYQEAGRAGRDGEKADCILYYSFKDQTRRKSLLMKDTEGGSNRQHLTVHMQNLRRMVEFCENQVECRRTLLLEYFGESFNRSLCHLTCDNCLILSQQKLHIATTDVTEACQVLLTLLRNPILSQSASTTSISTHELHVTLSQLVALFNGAAIPKKSFLSTQIDAFKPYYGWGKLKKFTRSEAERIVHHMILQQFICEYEKKNKSGFSNTVLLVGPKAGDLSNPNERVKLQCRTKRKSIDPSSAPTKTKTKPKSKPVKGTPGTTTKKLKKKTLNSSNSSSSKRKSLPVQSSTMLELLSNSSSSEEEGGDDDFEPEIVSFTSKAKTNSSCTQPYIYKSEQLKTHARIPEVHVDSLAAILKDWRASVCDNFQVMPYHILPNAGIIAIASAVPVTTKELISIEGVGRTRTKKYGEAIVELVQDYLIKHKLTPTGSVANAMDEDEEDEEEEQQQQRLQSEKKRKNIKVNGKNSSHFFTPNKKSLTAPIDNYNDFDDMDWDAVDAMCSSVPPQK